MNHTSILNVNNDEEIRRVPIDFCKGFFDVTDSVIST